MTKVKNIIPIDKALESHLDFLGFISTTTVGSFQVGDIVQVNPEVIPELNGSLVVVTEASESGVKGYISFPLHAYEGTIYYTLLYGTFKKVGHCAWILEGVEE